MCSVLSHAKLDNVLNHLMLRSIRYMILFRIKIQNKKQYVPSCEPHRRIYPDIDSYILS